MNHYVYEITNLINGKKYIGKRSCKCNIEDDKYMGSGKYLLRAMNKYGNENFSKKILKVLNCEEEAYKFEMEIIQKLKADTSDKYYNIAMGGKGGTCGINVSEETRKKHSITSSGRVMSKEARIKISNYHKNSEKSKLHIVELTKIKHKKVICLNNLMIFDSVIDANVYAGLGRESANISLCCKFKKKSAGKVNGDRAMWLHLDDYKKLSSEDIENIKLKNEALDRSGVNNHMYKVSGSAHHNSKKVIRLNDMKIYENAVEAYKSVGLSGPSKINACCRGTRSVAGKINNEKAKWMYYDNYIKECNNENK